MKEFTIGSNDAGQRLDRFLAKAVPLLPASLAQKYIRLKRIKCNGKRIDRDTRLSTGDVLQLYINDEFFDKPRQDNAYLTVAAPKLNIVYEDENILLTGGGEIAINENKAAFMLLTRIQDEVHRYSITYQRKKHSKQSFSLEITKIKGIGDKKAEKLLSRFKTKDELKKATVEEIAQAGGISQSVANDVYEFVQNSL